MKRKKKKAKRKAKRELAQIRQQMEQLKKQVTQLQSQQAPQLQSQQVTQLQSQQAPQLQSQQHAKQPMLDWLAANLQVLGAVYAFDMSYRMKSPDFMQTCIPGKIAEPEKLSDCTHNTSNKKESTPVETAKPQESSNCTSNTSNEKKSTLPENKLTICDILAILFYTMWKQTPTMAKLALMVVMLAFMLTPLHFPTPWTTTSKPDVVIQFCGQMKTVKNGEEAEFSVVSEGEIINVTPESSENVPVTEADFQFTCGHCGRVMGHMTYTDKQGEKTASTTHRCNEAGLFGAFIYAKATAKK